MRMKLLAAVVGVLAIASMAVVFTLAGAEVDSRVALNGKAPSLDKILMQ